MNLGPSAHHRYRPIDQSKRSQITNALIFPPAARYGGVQIVSRFPSIVKKRFCAVPTQFGYRLVST